MNRSTNPSDYIVVDNIANHLELKTGMTVGITVESWNNHETHHRTRNFALWAGVGACTAGFGTMLAIPGEMGGAFVLTELMQFGLGAGVGGFAGSIGHFVTYRGRHLSASAHLLETKPRVGRVVEVVERRWPAQGHEVRIEWFSPNDPTKSQIETHLTEGLVELGLKSEIERETSDNIARDQAEKTKRERAVVERINNAVTTAQTAAQRAYEQEFARRRATDEKRINDRVRAIIDEAKSVNPGLFETQELIAAQRSKIDQLSDSKTGKNRIITGLLGCNALWVLLILL